MSYLRAFILLGFKTTLPILFSIACVFAQEGEFKTALDAVKGLTQYVEQARFADDTPSAIAYSKALSYLIMTGNIPQEIASQPAYQGRSLLPIKTKRYGLNKRQAKDAEQKIIRKGLDALAHAALDLKINEGSEIISKLLNDNPHCQAAYKYFANFEERNKSKLGSSGDSASNPNKTPLRYEESAYAGVLYLRTIMPSFKRIETMLEHYPWIRRFDATTLVADKLPPAVVKQYLEKNDDEHMYNAIILQLNSLNLNLAIEELTSVINNPLSSADKEPAFKALVALKDKGSYLNDRYPKWGENFYLSSIRQNVIAHLVKTGIVETASNTKHQLDEAKDLSNFLEQIVKIADQLTPSSGATSEQIYTLRAILMVLYAHPPAAAIMNTLLQQREGKQNDIFSPYLYNNLNGDFDNAMQTLNKKADQAIVWKSLQELTEEKDAAVLFGKAKPLIVNILTQVSFPQDVIDSITKTTRENRDKKPVGDLAYLIERMIEHAITYPDRYRDSSAQLRVLKEILETFNKNSITRTAIENYLTTHEPGNLDVVIQKISDKSIAAAQYENDQHVIIELVAPGLFPKSDIFPIAGIVKNANPNLLIERIIRLSADYVSDLNKAPTVPQLEAIKKVLIRLNRDSIASPIMKAVLEQEYFNEQEGGNNLGYPELGGNFQDAIKAIDATIEKAQKKAAA